MEGMSHKWVIAVDLMLRKLVTIEGVGLVNCLVDGLKGGTYSAFSSFFTRTFSRGGSGMNEGNRLSVLFFLPGPAGLN